jgi:hypothetical protein
MVNWKGSGRKRRACTEVVWELSAEILTLKKVVHTFTTVFQNVKYLKVPAALKVRHTDGRNPCFEPAGTEVQTAYR